MFCGEQPGIASVYDFAIVGTAFFGAYGRNYAQAILKVKEKENQGEKGDEKKKERRHEWIMKSTVKVSLKRQKNSLNQCNSN